MMLQELRLNPAFSGVFLHFMTLAFLEKFPFSDATSKYLGFLDPRSHNNSPAAGVIKLATEEEMDTLFMEFQDFRASSDDQLPPGNLDEPAAIDHFWGAMGEVKLVTDLCTLRFDILSKLAKVLDVLPHSNADLERLFSMVRNISTQQRSQPPLCVIYLVLRLTMTTLSKSLMTNNLLSTAKSATRRMLRKETDNVTEYN